MCDKNLCSICDRNVSINCRRVLCDICQCWTHLKCSSLAILPMNSAQWFCQVCLSEIFPFNHYSNDTDFHFALSETPSNFDFNLEYNQLKYRHFNPFLNDSDTRYLLNNLDIDPNNNVFTENSQILSNCTYYVTKKFNNIFTNTSNCFSTLHFNIRSLKKNFADFNEYLSTINFSFSAIALSETWLNESTNDIYSIPGYTFVSSYRKNKRGGGVGIFIKSSFEYKLRPDLQPSSQDVIESIFVELIQPNCKNIVIGCIYKPPDVDVQAFNISLESVLTTIGFENKLCYIMGDYNINLFNYDSHSPTNEFIDLLSTNSFYPTISKPTRITSHSATLIDNIFTNNLDYNMVSGIFYSDLSDHLPIFQITNYQPKINTAPIIFQTRQITQNNINNFRQKLNNINWEEVVSHTSPNHSYNSFSDIFLPTYNECFPLKTSDNKTKKNSKPWYSVGLQNSCRRKNALYRTYLRCPTTANKLKYSHYRNKYNHIVKLSRKKYYHDKLAKQMHDLKATWSTIKSIIGTKPKHAIPSVMNDSNGEYNDPFIIANRFNDFFVNVGQSLSKRFPRSHNLHKQYLIGHYNKTIFLSPTSQSEIISIVNSLKNTRSEGVDGVNIVIVKSCIDLLAPTLSVIFNASISMGVVPDYLKIAKIIPVYKTDDRHKFSNYRPISILSCFSKILEKILYNRFIDFINKQNILFSSQYGFRKNHSTFMAILDLVDNISQAFENNEFTVGIFIDFKKAFDTVDHNILLDKLDFYGFRGIAHCWLKSYLVNRFQCVQISNVCSTLKPIKCGVPQGSILGPLLFLLYVNDIHRSSSLLSFILFADDTNIFFSGKNIQSVFNIINTELEGVLKWCNANKLTLHPDKTKFIIFHPSRKKPNVENANILIGGHSIERAEQTKFLGIIIHQNLLWTSHIQAITSKISRTIGILLKSRQFLEIPTLRLLYNSLILPYLQYCTIIWASTYKTHLNPILICQKKAVRILTYSPPLTHSLPLFKKLNLLTIYDIFKYQVSCFIYKHINNLLPQPIASFFNLNLETHHYFTRQRHNLHVTFHKYSFTLRSQGPKIWNSIPLDLRNSLKNFNYKWLLRDYYLSQL